MTTAFTPDSFFGNAWTWVPSHDDHGDPNIISGVRVITHSILWLLLTRKGEDPIHPDFGLAPRLFDPLSSYDPEYWVYNVEQEVSKWIAGIQTFTVRVSGYDAIDNQLQTEIYFTPESEPSTHLLTFPYYQYQDAVLNGNSTAFFSSLALKGQLFTGL